MRTIKSLRYLVAGCLLVTGLGVANVEAQATREDTTPASLEPDTTIAARSRRVEDSSSRNLELLMRGGYNLGRAPFQNIPGCVGPTSFCNMYFGS